MAPQKQLASLKSPTLFIVLLFAVFSLSTLIPQVTDGVKGCLQGVCGLILGSNFNDSVWYLAITNGAFHTFPFTMPNLSGTVLLGYHFLPNLITYVLSFTGIPAMVWYFQLLPLIFVMVFSILLFGFLRRLHANYAFIALGVVVVWLGATLSHAVSFVQTGVATNNNVMVPLFQLTRSLASLHFAFSLCIFLWVMSWLYVGNLTKKQYIWLIVAIAAMVGTKFYGGVLLAAFVGLYGLLNWVKEKKFVFAVPHALAAIFGFLLGVLLFYNPWFSKGGGMPFVWAPFALVHDMIESPRMFYSKDLVNARYFLQENGGLGPRLIAIEMWSLLLFIMYYFGYRVLGFFYEAKRVITTKTIHPFWGALTITSALSILIPLFFIQTGDWFNTLQFMAYGAFLMSFPTLFLFWEWWQKRWGKVLVVGVFLLFLPSLALQFTYPADHKNRFVLPRGEIEALHVLKKEPYGAVLAPTGQAQTTYVTAFSHKPSYLNYHKILINTGVAFDYKNRQAILDTLNNEKAQALPVQYVYLVKYDKKEFERYSTIFSNLTTYRVLFENDEAVIYKKL